MSTVPCELRIKKNSKRSGGVPPVRARTVLFPVTLVTIAGYKVSLRVQSERSERLRELTPAARRRGLYFIDRCSFDGDAL